MPWAEASTRPNEPGSDEGGPVTPAPESGVVGLADADADADADAADADADAAQRQPGHGTGVASEVTAEGARRWWPAAVCLGLYAVLAALEFGHFNGLGSDVMTGSRAEDQIAQVWWLAWGQYALAHGHSPFFTDWQNYPVGYNFGVNGSLLALGVVFSPITTVFGPVVSWNVLLRLAPVVSAFSMCLVLRRWVRWWPAAFIGGLLYGFSAYMTFYGSGYLFLTFVPIPPLIFLLLHEMVERQTWDPRRTGVFLGLACGVQYLIFPEVLASAVLLGVVACGLYLVFNRRTLTTKVPYLKTTGISALVAGALSLGLPVLFTLFGTQHSKGAVGSPANLAQYHGDLLGPLAPSHFLHFRTTLLGSLGAQPLTPSMYLGVPLVVAIVAIVYLLRSRGIVVLAGAMCVVSFLLSLGTILYVNGHDTHVPLPLVFLAYLPITEGFQSTRFSLYTVLFGAAILAIGLDVLRRRLARSGLAERLAGRWRMWVASAVTLVIGVVVVLPMLPAHTQPVTQTAESSWFTSPAASAIPEGSVVLGYPYPNAPYTPPGQRLLAASAKQNSVATLLLDQAVSGMRFKVIGSYGWRPTKGTYDSPRPSRLSPNSVQVLFNVAFSGSPSSGQAKTLKEANLVADLQEFLRRYHVGTVVVLPLGRSPGIVSGVVTAAIGEPSHQAGATVWLDVQHRLKVHTQQ